LIPRRTPPYREHAMLIDCNECHYRISDQAANCPRCGAPTAYPLRDVVAKPSGVHKSRALAILLAIFLGGIGAHKFYLERPGEGLFYLLFCWTFIPQLVALIDCVAYAAMSESKFQKVYGAGRLVRS